MASHPRKQRKISTGEAQPCVQKEKEILRIRAVEGRRCGIFKSCVECVHDIEIEYGCLLEFMSYTEMVNHQRSIA